jgi:hypothetical protein
MKLIKIINGKPYKVKGSPSYHHQTGWHFTASSEVKDGNGNLIEETNVKENILKQISNIEIEKHYKK